jgi:hypothetical protein
MQDSYNLWHAKQNVDLSEIKPIGCPENGGQVLCPSEI